MKLKAIIGETEHELSLQLVEGRVQARIGARSYDIAAREIEDGFYLMFVGDQVREIRVDGLVKIVDPRRLRSGQNSGGHHHGVAQIVAPMPGKVVRVHIEAGATVEKGAGVMVVEAMKMQNEMKSPRAGVVVAVNVKPGDTVNAGDVLAVLE
ncbi:MAG TPA: acetyl-CoA carboxylase biotin carboxyl carrier protein subunit [Pyrinomonadaceae bacterium]|nr:acetyl-CoA carboxylase biotin carboxyl carrier protein subunit [Pyrinomonadaceae bacterium]